MNCGRCNNSIEQERLEVLPKTKICAACARMLNPPKVKGAMIFEHKTAPTIHIMSAETFENEWKPRTPRFGMGSAVVRAAPRPR
jgi:hypothetical protein